VSSDGGPGSEPYAAPAATVPAGDLGMMARCVGTAEALREGRLAWPDDVRPTDGARRTRKPRVEQADNQAYLTAYRMEQLARGVPCGRQQIRCAGRAARRRAAAGATLASRCLKADPGLASPVVVTRPGCWRVIWRWRSGCWPGTARVCARSRARWACRGTRCGATCVS
jgi:hypothetical protein